jgi:hypothetical protein
MLRGLDVSGGGERNRIPIWVAERPTFEVTLYVRRDADDDRRAELRASLRRLTDAGVVESVSTRPRSASPPPDAPPDCTRPEAFGLAIRRKGTLVGWYPRREADRSSLEAGVRALCTGEGVENVQSTSADRSRTSKRQPLPVDSPPRHSPPSA